MKTDFPLRDRLSRLRLAGKEIRTRFLWWPPPPLPATAQVLYRSSDPGRRLKRVYWRGARPGCYRLDWSDAGAFDLDARRGRVRCFLRPRASATAVEEVLRGPVCSFFLLEQGFEALHAGAVAIAERCVAFVGPAGAGKSSLVASLTQLGSKFLSDDVLPLRCQGRLVRAYPGLPQLRLVPQAVRTLGLDRRVGWKTRWKATLPIPESSRRVSYPIARIYLLDRRNVSRPAPISLKPLSPREAFLALVAHTMNEALNATWRLERQLRLFGWLATRVPMRRLAYPSGFEQLERIRQSILRDLES